MFNELLTRPITESGFNLTNPKIDENKRAYIYANGQFINSSDIFDTTGSNMTLTKETNVIKAVINGDSVNNASTVFRFTFKNFFSSNSQKINMSGIKKIFIQWKFTYVNVSPAPNLRFGLTYSGNTSSFEPWFSYIDYSSLNFSFDTFQSIPIDYNSLINGASGYQNEYPFFGLIVQFRTSSATSGTATLEIKNVFVEY
jgi:hypothetical protein